MAADLSPWTLGLASGALALLAVLSLSTALLLRERGLHVHAAGCALAALVVNAGPLALVDLVPAGLAGIMGMAAMQVRGLSTQVGSLRPHRRAMSVIAIVLAALALLLLEVKVPRLLLPAVVLLAGLLAGVLARIWRDGLPWTPLVLAGQGALLAAGAWVGLAVQWRVHPLVLAGALAAWGTAVHLGMAWRARLQGERRLQLAAARHEDPITRLATEHVLDERVHAARALMRRFGHPSSVLLLHVDELERIASVLGPRAAEAATLEAGVRLRVALSRADVAARVGPYRFAVLAEGSSPQEVASSLAGRILVAGMKRPLSVGEGIFLRFRIVIAPLPLDEGPTEDLLRVLGKHMDREVRRGRERRVHVLAVPELQPHTGGPSTGTGSPGSADPNG